MGVLLRDVLVEAGRGLLAEEERPAHREGARRSARDPHARDLVADREIVGRDVSPVPREEEEAVDHGGHADVRFVLDLPHDLTFAIDRDDDAAAAVGGAGRHDGHAPIVRDAAQAAARLAHPELLAGARVEGEHLVRADAHDDAPRDDGAAGDRVLEGPRVAALELHAHERALAEHAHRDVGAARDRDARELPLERGHRGAVVEVGPVEGRALRLSAAAAGERKGRETKGDREGRDRAGGSREVLVRARGAGRSSADQGFFSFAGAAAFAGAGDFGGCAAASSAFFTRAVPQYDRSRLEK